jgi:hypothetical protein
MNNELKAKRTISFVPLNPYMKLRQNGIVSFSIRLAAFQARGGACMNLHLFRQDLQDYQDFFG